MIDKSTMCEIRRNQFEMEKWHRRFKSTTERWKRIYRYLNSRRTDFSHSHANAIVDFDWCRARLQLKCIERKKKPFIPEMRALRSSIWFLFSSPWFGCTVRTQTASDYRVRKAVHEYLLKVQMAFVAVILLFAVLPISAEANGSIREMFVLRNSFAL